MASDQAGKVIVVRNDRGGLNTHFRAFAKPMGIAANRHRLTIGGTNTVWEYHNTPRVAQKLELVGKHDGCYLPRRIQRAPPGGVIALSETPGLGATIDPERARALPGAAMSRPRTA